ncbi:hypothetical protein FOA52_007922 [Chlamydomonas sp. UWO 241]|nr:hypothetical protein FOA52_007922 [Chlamydomonas sp. UWO 241]
MSAATMEGDLVKVEAPAAPAGWELLFAGGTDWAQLGRSGGKTAKKDPKEEMERERLFPNLPDPTRLKSFMGVRVSFVVAGPSACHCIAADIDGRLFTWGRNEKGQLGQGDLLNRNIPRLVESMAGKVVVGGAGGKNHTVVITKDGESWSFGSNQAGQLGMGSIKKGGKGFEDLQLTAVKALVAGATAVAAGADFTVWIAGGSALAAGNPQYGQLGSGSDHAYNQKDSSISMAYESQPTPKIVKGVLATKIVSRIACGPNHTIAVDTEGSCYSWGNGGYGRLGHRVQKDEVVPTKIEDFKGRISVPANAIIAAGGTSSFSTTAPTGQVYSWGKLKVNGDNQMYPQVFMDLAGWNVRSLACGPGHFVVAADESVITWGHATNGELAYGPNGKKSSANPAKCNALEGVHVSSVAAGVGFTVFLAKPDDPKVAKLAVFDSVAPEVASGSAANEDGAPAKAKAGPAGAKRKAPETAKAGAKKAK